MRWISRDPIPPAGLAAWRDAALAQLRPKAPSITRDDAPRTYRHVATDLWKMQHYKCCYCEIAVHEAYNDVEHYRPFSRYWWLGWDWDNLLFACARCNRSNKAAEFELAPGSVPLVAEQRPPGGERPLLIDPSTEDPRAHIRYVYDGRRYWIPTGLTERGTYTIRLLALDDDGLLDQLLRHYETALLPVLARARPLRDEAPLDAIARRVLSPRAAYCCFARDVFAANQLL